MKTNFMNRRTATKISAYVISVPRSRVYVGSVLLDLADSVAIVHYLGRAGFGLLLARSVLLEVGDVDLAQRS
jgi:hypothetical protein